MPTPRVYSYYRAPTPQARRLRRQSALSTSNNSISQPTDKPRLEYRRCDHIRPLSDLNVTLRHHPRCDRLSHSPTRPESYSHSSIVGSHSPLSRSARFNMCLWPYIRVRLAPTLWLKPKHAALSRRAMELVEAWGRSNYAGQKIVLDLEIEYVPSNLRLMRF